MDIKNILADGEQIEHTTKANLAPFFVPFAVSLIAAIPGLIMSFNHDNGIKAFGVILVIIAGLILIFALTRLEVILSTKIYVTDKRVILKSGFFSSKQSEIPLDRISGMTIVEPLLGKLFHYGTVIVESSASTVGVRAMYISRPYDFKKTLKVEQR